MVDAEVNYEKKTALVSCPTKSKSSFKIKTAPGGFIFYEVSATTGKVPEELSGRFSGLDVAVKAVTKHYELMPKSKAVKLANNRKRAEEHRNATAGHTEGSQ